VLTARFFNRLHRAGGGHGTHAPRELHRQRGSRTCVAKTARILQRVTSPQLPTDKQAATSASDSPYQREPLVTKLEVSSFENSSDTVIQRQVCCTSSVLGLPMVGWIAEAVFKCLFSISLSWAANARKSTGHKKP